MKKTLIQGRSKIVITGDSREAVEMEVNRLYNVAAITGYPGERVGDVRKGEIEIDETHTGFTIVCSTYKKRFLAGLIALGMVELQRSAGVRHTMRLNKPHDARRLAARAIVRAAHIYRNEFTVESAKDRVLA